MTQIFGMFGQEMIKMVKWLKGKLIGKILRMIGKRKVNSTPFATIHIAKSRKKPNAQTKTCQRVWLPQLTGGIGYLYFHMNWGWGGNHDGWFAFNNVDSGNGNYQYARQNFYITKP